MYKLGSYLYKILLYITQKLPELTELPFLMPGPCSEEKVHLLFDHLSDTLTATFLYQSLHELALRNTILKKEEIFRYRLFLKGRKERQIQRTDTGLFSGSFLSDTNLEHDSQSSLFLFHISTFSKQRKSCFEIEECFYAIFYTLKYPILY